jgi:hypothetical protein
MSSLSRELSNLKHVPVPNSPFVTDLTKPRLRSAVEDTLEPEAEPEHVEPGTITLTPQFFHSLNR